MAIEANSESARGHRSFQAIAVPAILLVALGVTLWVSVFAGGIDDIPPNLQARRENELPGFWAARFAIAEIRTAVPNGSAGHAGLLAGTPRRVSVRYEDLGSVSSWTVYVRGPVRVRPNTPDEFVTQEGEIVIEIAAVGGDIAGNFSAGRGVLNDLGISPDDFIEVPLRLVWPPVDVWIRL